MKNMEKLKRPPTYILKNLYLGNGWNSCFRDQLIEYNIQYILNLGYPHCKNHFENVIIYI